MVQDFLVGANLHLGARILVGELDAGLVVVDHQDLNVDLQVLTWLILCS